MSRAIEPGGEPWKIPGPTGKGLMHMRDVNPRRSLATKLN
jgi:hypothetical protein